MCNSDKVRQFTKEELDKATSSYGALIGKGGFGSVYLGVFHGLEVAVKKLDVSGLEYEQYINTITPVHVPA